MNDSSTRCDLEVNYPYHSFRCSYGPVDTAHHPALACLKDKIPEDPETLEDFEFSVLFL